MTLKTSLMIFDDGDFSYVGTCSRCSFISQMCADEDEAFAAWRSHRCSHG